MVIPSSPTDMTYDIYRIAKFFFSLELLKMPYRRRTTTRRGRKRPTRRKTYRKYRPRRKKKMMSTVMRIPRPIRPIKTAFCTHKAIRYIRIPGRVPGGVGTPQPTPFAMSGFGSDAYTSGGAPFPHLLISCNDPMAVLNQLDTPTTYPGPSGATTIQTPAFFSSIVDPAQSACLFDTTGQQQGELPATTPRVDSAYSNKFPSRWLKMVQFFQRWTCVGSRIRITFQPNTRQVPGYENQQANPAIFIFGKRTQRNIKTLSPYPQNLEEAPNYQSKQWFGRRTDQAKYNAIQFTGKWSARKDMQLQKGNIVNNSQITGLAEANPSRCLLGNQEYVGPYLNTDASTLSGTEIPEDASEHPGRQNYWHFAGVSGLNDGDITGPFAPSFWPSGIIKIELEYGVVWSSYRKTDNETVVQPGTWNTIDTSEVPAPVPPEAPPKFVN